MPWLEKPGQGEGSGQEGKRCQTLCTCSRRKLRRWTFLASVPYHTVVSCLIPSNIP